MTDLIPGGHFLLSRKIYLSAIWEKPPQYLKLFVWLIGRAVFQDGYTFKGHTLKRGELITTLGEIADSLSYRLNRAIKKPTEKQVRIMLSWLKLKGMIMMKPVTGLTLPNKGTPNDRTRAYIGLLVYIINYDTYQDAESYKGTNKGTPKDELGQIDKEGLERMKKTPCDFSSKISELGKRYSDQETINQVFQAISSARKSNRIADSVKLSILQSWERYPIEAVMTGITIFLKKGCNGIKGKPEDYLKGIIRNNGNGQQQAIKNTGGQVMKSTGSPLLDEHYRDQGIEII